MAASLARLTSLSTQTLSLLLERQRLPNSTLHGPQIVKNLQQLRAGILDLEQSAGVSEATRLLRAQHERMRGMLGAEADSMGVQRCEEPAPPPADMNATASSSTSTPSPPSSSPEPLAPTRPSEEHHHHPFTPYTDDPEAGYSQDEMLLQQRQIMDNQDVHLDELSRSISRQRDLSLQIGDELEVHTGLLEGLDHDLDRTDSRLSHARRKLDRVAKGAKENGSTVMIALLILVLLILIIVFKT